MNGSQAAGEQTVFQGETVSTAAGGTAVLTLPGTGMLNIESGTDISFGTENYLALLKRGTVEIRSVQADKNVVIEFGTWLMYLPSFEDRAAGKLTVGADGAARIECLEGSVALTAQNSTAVAFLQPGQSVNISANGTMGQVESSTPAGSPAQGTSTSTPKPAAKSHTGIIILGVAAGGAGAAAAIVLATRHKQPVSPSTPQE